MYRNKNIEKFKVDKNQYIYFLAIFKNFFIVFRDFYWLFFKKLLIIASNKIFRFAFLSVVFWH